MSSPTVSDLAAPAPADLHLGEPIIQLDGVGVRYRLPRERIASFKDYAIRWLKRSLSYDELWALRGVTMEIRRGEAFGIIGHNGAGKSTLLKLIARVLRPTEGRVRVAGRVAPLLELGAGFDYELTGRENVFLNGTILGFSGADIASRFDRIVEFAGLREFIDMPLRTYSTGMVARLGFAVATDVKPDVLIVDEVLAVGDGEFQARSRERMETFRGGGQTVIMVSHNLVAVSNMCQRAAWLDHGRLRAIGPVAEVVDAYQAAIG
jgi:ABC-2 type transport system ATP-binding protein/lipopolysaccharide transport system ATP-binding protein